MRDDMRDSIISTRIRLARNIRSYPFPSRLTAQMASEITKKITDALSSDFDNFKVRGMSEVETGALVERHLISKELMGSEFGSVSVDGDETVSVMLNEEDHARIQVILPGFCLHDAYTKCEEIDDMLEEKVRYAFSSKVGYLTACPTNLGTGMRASVMVFLPALKLLKKLKSKIAELGNEITVRGVYGEGSDGHGFIYQISNRVSLGLSEREILDLVGEAVEKLCVEEERARETLLVKNKDKLTDEICRALGTAVSAHLMSIDELSRCCSMLKLGVYYGILPLMPVRAIDELMDEMQHYTLVSRSELIFNDEIEEQIYRARRVRKTFEELLRN